PPHPPPHPPPPHAPPPPIKESILHGNGRGFASSGSGYTILHLLASNGLSQYVKVLLAKGAKVDARDKNNCTPLHFSSWNGHSSTSELLIKRGANIDAKS